MQWHILGASRFTFYGYVIKKKMHFLCINGQCIITKDGKLILFKNLADQNIRMLL